MASFFRNKNTIILVLVLMGTVFLSSGFVYADPLGGDDAEKAAQTQQADKAETDSSLLAKPFEWMFEIAGWLYVMAGILFAWIAKPENIVAIVGSDAVYQVWTTVRDFLNMFFILVLLFSAFATIFQIDKYNIRKILLNLVLMALLVNFSFPITRFIIDVSNVIMYHFLNNMFVGDASNFAAMYGQQSYITDLLMPKGAVKISYLIIATAFLFILSITILIIGVLLLIRLVALAILVMFSPIGFVGNIFPGFEKHSSSWWDALFKYAFSGPIMVFFVAVSLMMLQAVRNYNDSSPSLRNIATSNSMNDNEATWLANMVFMMVPIIMLWVGIGSAQKVTGIAGAGAVSNFGKGMAKKFSGYNWANRNYGNFKKERDKRREEMEKKSVGSSLGERANNAQDRALAAMGSTTAQKRYDKRTGQDNKDDIKKESENHEGTATAQLHTDIQGMNAAAVAAMNDKALKEAAGKVKQALSRGAAYEKEVEKSLKALGAGHAGLSGVKPPDPRDAVITAGMSAGDIALEQAREKKEKDALNKWVQEEKAALMDQSRNVIKEAENRGKIKP